jgi:hypothetical protein
MITKGVTLAFLLAAGTACAVYVPPPDAPPPPPPGADVEVDASAGGVDLFYNQLSPYGEWVVREGYGRVWIPRVAVGWRPYTTGHWVYTDDGWAWVAEESWGWAPFHYGRWYDDDEYGWSWVPGTVWAPAWVAWRSGGGYVGWAALPPAVGFGFGAGLELGGVNLDVAIRPAHYCFVAEGAILAPRVAAVLVPVGRNVTFVSRTTNITNITVVNNRVVNNGIAVQQIERATGHPVPHLQIAAAGGPGAHGVAGNRVNFYRPAALERAARARPSEFGRALPAQATAQPRLHEERPAQTGAGGGGRAGGGAGAGGGRGLNADQLQKRQASERQQLAQHQKAESQHLAQIHQQERGSTRGGGNAGALAQQHTAEVKAQQEQHQRQQAQLQARHQRESQAARPSAPREPKGGKPPH